MPEEIVAILTALVFPILVWAALIAALVCIVRDCMRGSSLDDLSLHLDDDSHSGTIELERAVYPRQRTGQQDEEEEKAWAPKQSSR